MHIKLVAFFLLIQCSYWKHSFSMAIFYLHMALYVTIPKLSSFILSVFLYLKMPLLLQSYWKIKLVYQFLHSWVGNIIAVVYYITYQVVRWKFNNFQYNQTISFKKNSTNINRRYRPRYKYNRFKWKRKKGHTKDSYIH